MTYDKILRKLRQRIFEYPNQQKAERVLLNERALRQRGICPSDLM